MLINSNPQTSSFPSNSGWSQTDPSMSQHSLCLYPWAHFQGSFSNITYLMGLLWGWNEITLETCLTQCLPPRKHYIHSPHSYLSVVLHIMHQGPHKARQTQWGIISHDPGFHGADKLILHRGRLWFQDARNGNDFFAAKKKQCEWHSKSLGSLIPKWQGSAEFRKQHSTEGLGNSPTSMKLEMAKMAGCGRGGECGHRLRCWLPAPKKPSQCI